jgi:peptidoglycan-associated lipoprotein
MFGRIVAGLSLLALAFTGTGCPKQIPQAEIDAAESAMSSLEKSKDCAPETYQAAKTMMDRAQALIKEERYEEAKTALLAAKQLAAKAAEECEKKRKEDLARQKAEADALAASKQIPVTEAPPPETGPAGLATVYFRFNDFDLTDEAMTVLQQNADYLRLHPEVKVQIEGHCDSRGSTEYNLSLGERRAMSVKGYLVKLGTNPERLNFISYGAERPVDPAPTEEAYAKNRRAEFHPVKNP